MGTGLPVWVMGELCSSLGEARTCCITLRASPALVVGIIHQVVLFGTELVTNAGDQLRPAASFFKRPMGTLAERKNSKAGLVDPAFRFRTGSSGLVSTWTTQHVEITELWL